MAEENVDDMPLANAEGGKSSKQNPLIPVVILLVVALAGSWALSKFVLAPMVYAKQEHAGGEGEQAEKEAVMKLQSMQSFEFNEITTNLGGGSTPRYVRVSFTLEGTNPNFLDVVQAGKPRINDAALSVLQSLSVQEAQQTGIKNIVASDLVSRINTALQPAPPVVEKIYFTEFVIQ